MERFWHQVFGKRELIEDGRAIAEALGLECSSWELGPKEGKRNGRGDRKEQVWGGQMVSASSEPSVKK